MIRSFQRYLSHKNNPTTSEDLYRVASEMDELYRAGSYQKCDEVFSYILADHLEILQDLDISYGLFNAGSFYYKHLPSYMLCYKAFRDSLLEKFTSEEIDSFLGVLEEYIGLRPKRLGIRDMLGILHL